MSTFDVIRAWEDPEYRKSLSPEDRAKLPANPVGEIELTEDELTHIMGTQNSGNSTGCNTATCTRGNSANPCFTVCQRDCV